MLISMKQIKERERERKRWSERVIAKERETEREGKSVRERERERESALSQGVSEFTYLIQLQHSCACWGTMLKHLIAHVVLGCLKKKKRSGH